jgi:hypothetical protein
VQTLLRDSVNGAGTRKGEVDMPDFDDKDLAMICITIIVLFTGVVMAWKGSLEVGLPLMTAGVTALGSLATGRKKE